MQVLNAAGRTRTEVDDLKARTPLRWMVRYKKDRLIRPLSRQSLEELTAITIEKARNIAAIFHFQWQQPVERLAGLVAPNLFAYQEIGKELRR